ncbi:hypothetical protein [Reichenbachiella sp. MALMAid0571]|uniref:hypothetical protein n=1 Tax=Reichenbachiella sp. MALMAid0571 TaxID=3143939 RepID=UPI0032DF9751
MKYVDPKDVKSPKSQISGTPKIIYDGGNGDNAGDTGFSLARITWGGKETLAIRWNVSHAEWDNQSKVDEKTICKGNPTSRGYPTWFVIPEQIFDPSSAPWKDIMKNL